MRAQWSGEEGGLRVEFEEAGLAANTLLRSDTADIAHFFKDIETLNLPQIKNQPEIEKIKKRIEAFAKQYGEKT